MDRTPYSHVLCSCKQFLNLCVCVGGVVREGMGGGERGREGCVRVCVCLAVGD